MAFLVHMAAWTRSSRSASPPPPPAACMLTHALVAWRDDGFGGHEMSVSVRGNWNYCYECYLCLTTGKHWAEKLGEALGLGKWRLQNLLKHHVCRDFLKPWSRAWEAEVQAVSQNNYSKIFCPRCLEMSSWGSSDCSGVAPGGHSPPPPNDRWALCTLVGWDVAPEIFYWFFS